MGKDCPLLMIDTIEPYETIIIKRLFLYTGTNGKGLYPTHDRHNLFWPLWNNFNCGWVIVLLGKRGKKRLYIKEQANKFILYTSTYKFLNTMIEGALPPYWKIIFFCIVDPMGLPFRRESGIIVETRTFNLLTSEPRVWLFESYWTVIAELLHLLIT